MVAELVCGAMNPAGVRAFTKPRGRAAGRSWALIALNARAARNGLMNAMDGIWLIGRALLLLAAANISPIAVKGLLGDRWSLPLDGGLRFIDGEPLLGRSKTVRGLVTAAVAAALAAVAMGLPALLGAELGALAMLGDALASFGKRRLKVAPSARATGLDQIPESLLPLILLRGPLGLSWLQVAAVTLAFFVIEIPLARISFRFGLRDRPF